MHRVARGQGGNARALQAELSGGSPGEAASSGRGLGPRRAGLDDGSGLLSPRSLKYLGSRTSEKVKNKILELLYSWTVGLPEEVKIAEAYQMLKKQGEGPRVRCGQRLCPSSPSWGFWQLLAVRSWGSPLPFQEALASGAFLWLCLKLGWVEGRCVWVKLLLREWPPQSGLKICLPRLRHAVRHCSSEPALAHPSPELAGWRKSPPALACPPPSHPPPWPEAFFTAFLPPSTPGIVKSDPKLPDDATFPLPPPRPKNVIFEDEEKSKVQLQGRVGGAQEDLQGLRCPSSRRWLPRPEAGAHEGRVTVVGDRRVGEALLCAEHVPPRVLAFSRHEPAHVWCPWD